MVYDAFRRECEAWMEPSGCQLILWVDERAADDPLTIDPVVQTAYLEASNADAFDRLGWSVGASGDTVVVGARRESSSGTIGDDFEPGQVQNSSATGSIRLALDLSRQPTPTGFVAVQSGETWSFQCWYRDTEAGLPTSNFSDGVAVTFR